MSDASLRNLLETLSPKARETLRRVLIHDQADRDAISSQLLRYRGERGDDWADIIDMLTMHPETRRQVAPRGDGGGRQWVYRNRDRKSTSPGTVLPFDAVGRTLDKES